MLIHIRKDLLFYQRQSKSGIQWIVKDPIVFSHFLFSEEEVFLLKLFDGSRSLVQIREAWQEKFKTRSLTMPQLNNMVQRFLADHLLIADQFGQGKRLREKRQIASSRQFWTRLTSPYLFRIGGFNPRILLDVFEVPAKFLFHPITVITNLAIALLVLFFFVGHFENISHRTSLMSDFFSYKNVLVITLVVVGVKILHELGHALACRKFGGECFEIGILFVAMFPTLYCDVSDSWKFKEKWKRILVAFAGIYIEIILATFGAILWLTTSPGFANTVFFNIAIMCSVNTLLINGNPLLKYDGYYLFSDAFDQPNLASRAQQQLQYLMGGLFLKTPTAAPINLWLCLYGVFALLYSLFVIIAILAGMALIMKTLAFGRLGNAVIFTLLVLMVGRQLAQNRFKTNAGLRKCLGAFRSSVLLGILALLFCAFLFVKLPSSICCQFVVEPASSLIVYAPRDGELKLNIGAFEQVESGQNLAQILDPHLNEQLERSRKELANLNQRHKIAVKLQTESPQAAAEVEQLKNQIQKTQSHIDSLGEKVSSLLLNSDRSGMVKPLTLTGSESDGSGKTNVTLLNTAFDVENRDLLVRRGQPLLTVEGSKRSLIARLEEKSIDRLEVGQKAVLKFERLPSEVFNGFVAKIIKTESVVQPSPKPFFDDEDSDQPTQARSDYRVIISASKLPSEIASGSIGRVRISISPSTAAEKFLFLANQWWQ